MFYALCCKIETDIKLMILGIFHMRVILRFKLIQILLTFSCVIYMSYIIQTLF